MGAPHSLARSIRAMTIGSIKSYNDRRDAVAVQGLGELDQQFQIALSGQAGPIAAWGELTVAFGAPFLDGHEDRDPPFVHPVVTYGSVVTSGGPLVIVCNVKEWIVDEDYVLGATLEIGVWRTTTFYGDYVGALHLNFQGWGAPVAPEPDAEGLVAG